MHIITAFIKLTRLSGRKLQGLFDSSYEEVPASDSPAGDGLTQGYNEFTHSWAAFWLCLGHGFAYYALAVTGYSFLFEKWPIEDSMYFATVVFTTVGYGDLSPSNRNSQVFTMGLVVYGIIILGLFIGILGDILIEYHQNTQEARVRNVSNSVLDTLAQKHEEAVSSGPSTSGKGQTVMSPSEVDPSTRLLQTEGEEEESPSTQNSLLRDIWNVILLEAPIVSIVVLIGIFFGWLEGWSVLESVYFVVITGTTVGLGDLTPHSPAVRILSILFLPFAVAVLGELLARIASTYMDRKQRKVDREFLSHRLTMCDIETMDTNRDGEVDRAEFVIYMLVALQRVDKDDVDEIIRCFNRLDRTKSDSLTPQDLSDNGWNENFRETLKATEIPSTPEASAN